MPAYRGPDRRGFQRIETEGDLPGQLSLSMDSRVLELSVGGMLIELAVPLAVGSKHRFTLDVEREEFELRGVVRNCKPLPEGQTPSAYRIGIQFDGLGERQQHLLERVVAQKLNS